ncbi:MAG: beta-ketoacyl synthase N-terminal-like domain-containing protein, partial [Pseudomonadota bacterium]
MNKHLTQTVGEAPRKIAVVGMSGKYPQADNLSIFWNNIANGKNAITEIPKSRWDVAAFYDEVHPKKDKIYCKSIGMINDVEYFDPLFFRISPSEAQLMDPQQRHFLQESYRAFEDAGYAEDLLDNINCGVYLGVLHNEYTALLSQAGAANVDSTGNNFAIAAARIAYYLNLKGPAIAIDTSCSSSLVAVHLACQALISHEVDMALAGGVTFYLTPDSYIKMCQSGMLSADGQCKTFDDDANGFVPGEGVGAVVLKRLEDAERDGDAIYGVINGSGINQDGKTNGITAPSVISQVELQRKVYQKYDIDPKTISYIETHGTGTKLGDPIELQALATVFQAHSPPNNYCALASVKTNIGHASGAAGIAGLQKALLALRHKKIPPSLNFNKENAHFDFQNSPFYVNTKLKNWSRHTEAPLRAAVNSFGFSGTNAHVVVEEYQPAHTRHVALGNSLSGDSVLDKTNHIYMIPLSAKKSESLIQMADNLYQWLNDNTVTMSELAYTLQTGRKHMENRVIFVIESQQALLKKLAVFIDNNGPDTVPIGDGIFSALSEKANKKITDPAISALLKTPIQDWQQPDCEAIATLWVKGAAFNWPGLYGNNTPKRMHLPGYAFAKEYYWLPQSATRSDKTVSRSTDNTQTSMALTEVNKNAIVLEILPEKSTKEHIVDYLRLLLAEKLGMTADQLDLDTNIYDWGLDSIAETELVMQMNKTLVDVPDDVFLDYSTIQQLSDYLQENYSEVLKAFFNRELSAKLPVNNPQLSILPGDNIHRNHIPKNHAPKNHAQNNQAFPELVALNGVTEGSPIFWIHAKLGGVQPYLKIAEQWQRPAYGIQARGWLTERSPLHGIQAIAAYYVHIIQSVQAQGPYELGGHSLGGILAYEVARQLQELGENVSSIVMIDTPDSSQINGLKRRSIKSEMLETVNFFIRPPGVFSTQALSQILIHRDNIDNTLDDDAFLEHLLSLASKSPLTIRSLSQTVK